MAGWDPIARAVAVWTGLLRSTAAGKGFIVAARARGNSPHRRYRFRAHPCAAESSGFKPRTCSHPARRASAPPNFIGRSGHLQTAWFMEHRLPRSDAELHTSSDRRQQAKSWRRTRGSGPQVKRKYKRRLAAVDPSPRWAKSARLQARFSRWSNAAVRFGLSHVDRNARYRDQDPRREHRP